MDSEKENPIVEKSEPDVKTESVVDTDNKKDPEKLDLDQDINKNNEDGSQPAADPPLEGEAEAKQDNVEHVVESEIKEGEEANPPPDQPNVEETPYLPPDLDKVSEEIDQYILTLSASKGEESTPPDVPIFVEQFVVLVEAKIEKFNSSENHVKWSQLTEEDSSSFIDAVNRVSFLSKALSDFSSDFKYAYSINCIGGVLQRLMSYMEEEFKLLLEEYKINDSDSTTTTNNNNDNKGKNGNNDAKGETEQNSPPKSPKKEDHFPGYSDEVLSNLVKLSKAMFVGGYEKECCQVYFVARRTALEDSLHKLGFEKFSIDDVQRMHWESLEREIEAWIKTFKQCSTVQFSGERKLSDKIFSGQDSVSDRLSGSLAHGAVMQLLNFAEAVALTKRAPEKLFKFLDLYESLRDVLPAVEESIPEEWANQIKTDISMIRTRLGEAMILIVVELENAIKSDSAKTPVPGGAVHPLTKYIMNYLTYTCEYRETLEQVFREHQKIERADSATGSEFNFNSSESQDSMNNNNNQAVTKQSPFQAQVIKVMDLLDSYVEGKSKLYRDIPLSSIFLMNNGRYILQKIKGSNELKSLMDDSWCRKKSSELRQYHKGYQRETWGKLLTCLNPEGLLTNGKVVKPVLKERFNSFNKLFDEIHKTQTTWVVGDEQLQSELRVSISNMVIPAYRSFLGRFSQVFTPGRQTEKYVKFQPEDIETYIDELFDGNAAPAGRRKM